MLMAVAIETFFLGSTAYDFTYGNERAKINRDKIWIKHLQIIVIDAGFAKSSEVWYFTNHRFIVTSSWSYRMMFACHALTPGLLLGQVAWFAASKEFTDETVNT